MDAAAVVRGLTVVLDLTGSKSSRVIGVLVTGHSPVSCVVRSRTGSEGRFVEIVTGRAGNPERFFPSDARGPGLGFRAAGWAMRDRGAPGEPW